jgi:hypothetical protein
MRIIVYIYITDMAEAKNSEKAGRKLVQFWLPDYTYENVEKVVGTGNVNSLVKLLVNKVSKGELKLELIEAVKK